MAFGFGLTSEFVNVVISFGDRSCQDVVNLNLNVCNVYGFLLYDVAVFTFTSSVYLISVATSRYSTKCRKRYGDKWAEFLTPREEESLDVLYHTTKVP